jgi:PAS domain S-box-containing protein
VTNQLAIALDRNRARAAEVRQRREAERQRARYEQLVDDLDDAFVWQADVDTRQVTYISAQFARIFGGVRQHELADTEWWDAFVPPEDRARLAETFDGAAEQRGSKQCDHRCVTATGQVRWLRTAIHVVDHPGEAAHFQGLSFDITVARLAQEQVQEQLAFTSAMASSLGEGTLAIGLDGVVTFINGAAIALLGCEGQEIIGGHGVEFGHVETLAGDLVESPVAVAMRTGEPVRSDAHMIKRPDGARFAASYTASPIRRDGRVTGAVIAFDDINERRRAQETGQFLLEAGAALSASLESTAVTRALAMVGVPLLGEICLVDVLSTHDQLLRTAWAPSLSGSPDGDTGELDADFGVGQRSPMFSAAVFEVIATGKPSRIVVEPGAPIQDGELALATRRGIRSFLIVPLTLGRRKVGALTFCCTTERRPDEHDVVLAEGLALRGAIAIEHARLFEQARQAVALRDQTLAIVSHDLRGPLGTIVMAAGMLGDPELAADPQMSKLAVGKIDLAATRMERMIGDLLDFASIEAGKLAIVTRPQDVAEILHEAVSSFEQAARQLDVKLTASSQAMPAVQCDRGRILQVIGNLVGNALKSVKAGATVRLHAELHEGVAVWSVADTGPGIPHAEQRRLFERYWRSPDATYKGTGLGLAIAQGIVDAHGGTIWVNSDPGHGATFFFTVPLALAQAA